MSWMRAVVAVVVAIACVAAPPVLAAPTPLQAALDLYAAAAYEDALAAFDTVSPEGLGLDERALVAQHRMLCLMAMGRTADAERAAASLLGLRPDFVLAARDASPRVRAMFDAARRRVLPSVVRERYAAARRLYDTGALAEARAAFASVSAALGAALVASDPALADVRTLADGFLALTTAAAPRGEAAAPIAVEPSTERPVERPADGPRDRLAPVHVTDPSASLVWFPTDSAVSWREADGRSDVSPRGPADGDAAAPGVAARDHAPTTAMVAAHHGTAPAASGAPDPPVLAPTPATAEAAPGADSSVEAPESSTAPAPAPAMPAAAGAPFAPIDIFTYDWRDKDVTPPVPVAQALSGWWGSMGEPPAGTPLGAVALVIDEHGKVADAKIYLSVNRVYDAVLLTSVGQWRYTPATRGGRAVKYRRISSVVSGR